ncbi:septal ring lytic transglycosylase RlpA family protein [Parasediminibacterium sp. JCM 36343]|uniref:septal ring lytic transglycosylase RlpA family protein n=1 Tax=Parasediminibacterium sp. JCM 36343 TaxID=3374279 RepID=UPI00397973B9
MKKILYCLVISICLIACHRKSIPDGELSGPGTLHTQTGIASFYSDKFSGSGTASGETYQPSKYTAAHRTLPFGTMVKVTNKANGKSVIVRINDRGPFAAGRIIDLSKAAAKAIDMVNAGVVSVVILYRK